MSTAYCPNCDAVVSVNKPEDGAKVRCNECRTELEIISTDPFEVDFPLDYYDEDEDWDDE